MKCLGIALLMDGKNNFNFENIPIPVDYRVKKFTKRLGIKISNDDEIRKFWNLVLGSVRNKVNVNIIHLDSLIWQIGTLSKEEIIKYFREMNLEDLGKEIAEIVLE